MGGRWNLMAAVRSCAAPLVDFIYPPVCFLCSDPLEERNAVVCRPCWESFPRADPSHPAWRGLEERAAAAGIDGIAACWLFEKHGRLQEAVHLLKYRRVRSIGVRMGEELGRLVRERTLIARAGLLVPVPVHPARRRERGYNQCELIAEGVARETGLPVERSLLVRTAHMPSQTMLGGSLRRANVARAFGIDAARGRILAGADCILVDDVITTGATLAACAALLRGAGARRVFGACVALAA